MKYALTYQMVRMFIFTSCEHDRLGEEKGALIGRYTDPAGSVAQVDRLGWFSSLHEYQTLQGRITGGEF